MFALQAGRKELMKLAIAQVERNEIEPTKELVVNLLKVLAEYVDDRFNQSRKIRDLEEQIESFQEDMDQIRRILTPGSRAV